MRTQHRSPWPMNQLREGLKPNDLSDLIKPVFDVDAYKSKMGEDENVVVLSFEVTGSEPSKDVVNFIEKGYDFVLDADVSSGETGNGTFRVFVELERKEKVSEKIQELLYGLGELSGIKEWRFRYHKEYKSLPLDDLAKSIPITTTGYKQRVDLAFENNIRFFFRKSPLEYFLLEHDTVTFKRSFNSPLKMEIINYGTRTDVLNDLAGSIRIDETSTSEAIWLTKYFGDYNITKYDENFVFENDNTVFLFKLRK